MIHPVSNRAEDPREEGPPEESRRVLVFLSIALTLLIVSAALGGILFASSVGIKPNTIIAKLRTLTLSREKMLRGENNDRINILLLGMGGVGHEGATLTDTIILASLRPSDKQIGLLSIPRDLQVNIPGYGYRKVNSVNAYGERDEPGSGGKVTAALISRMHDQPIHYYLRLDFTAFKEIIDSVGGIEVEVEQAFYDPFYPDNNFGYAPVSFEKGWQNMGGDRALKFARSRHGTNGEGNDFARARRQQKVLFALKERMLSFDVLLRPKRIRQIMESLQSHIQTNLTLWEGLRLAKLFKDTDTAKIVSRVLDASPDGLLIERNYDGAFVLEPKTGNWSEVRALTSGLLDAESTTQTTVILSEAKDPTRIRERTFVQNSSSPTTPRNDNLIAPPIIEIQNGTHTTGLAARTAEKLEALGFNASTIGNASVRDVKNTIVYDLTGGKNPDALKKLKDALAAIDGQGEPSQLISRGKLDFLVILGQNAVQ